MNEIDNFIKTEDDILEDKKKEILDINASKEKQLIQKDVIKLFKKNFEILNSRKDFREKVEEKIKILMDDDTNDEMTATHLVKLYEIIANSEVTASNSVTRIFGDVLKSNTMNFNINNTNTSDMTKEEMKDIMNTMKLIVKAKDLNK